MIKVDSINGLNRVTKKATVSLFSDTKQEVDSTPLTDIIDFPKGYSIAFGSDVMTADGDMAFYKSTGQWNWV